MWIWCLDITEDEPYLTEEQVGEVLRKTKGHRKKVSGNKSSRIESYVLDVLAIDTPLNSVWLSDRKKFLLDEIEESNWNIDNFKAKLVLDLRLNDLEKNWDNEIKESLVAELIELFKWFESRTIHSEDIVRKTTAIRNKLAA